MPRLPGFIGATYADLTRPVDAQETINLFLEKVESGKGANDMILRKVPGKLPYALLPDGPIRGMFAQDGRCFVVAGVSLCELQLGQMGVSLFESSGLASLSWVRIGTVESDDYQAYFASNGAGGNQLFIVSGGSGYIYTLTNGPGTFTQIGGGFPSNARRACFIDGYFFTMSGIFVYASNLEDGLTWSAASKAQRSVASDDLQSIEADGHKTLWLVGSKTSEPWYDAGQTPFPYAPQQNVLLSHGTGAADSVTRFDNTIFALAQSENGDRYAIVVANGQAAQRVSTHAIENAWRMYPRVSDAVAWTYSEMGHNFVVLTFPSARATWVYDAAVGMWHRRGFFRNGQYEADSANCHAFCFGKHLVGSRKDGTIYDQGLNHVTDYDNGVAAPIRWLRRAPHLTNERKWIYFSSFELVAEVGQGAPSGYQPDTVDPQVSMTYSDDGGYTWANQRTRSLGLMGQYRTQVIWNRLGRSRDRVFEVNGSSPVKTTLIDALVHAQ